MVKGRKVLPGVACLEMARAAVEEAASTRSTDPSKVSSLRHQLRHGMAGQARIQLKIVVWARSVVVGELPLDVHIGLFPEENGQI